jgi:fructokinase
LKPEAPIIALGELLWDLLPTGRRAGGAPFNFAFHCNQLGHPAVIVSRVGDDNLGRELREEVKRLGMSDEFIQTDREHATGTVTVQLDAKGQPTYTITENVAWDFIDWEPRLAELAGVAGAVCFGTLAQRASRSRNTICAFIPSTNSECLAVCDINFRKPFLSKEVIDDSLRLADWLKASEQEAAELARSLDAWPAEFVGGVGGYWRQRLLPAILSDKAVYAVTRGPNGCVVGDVRQDFDLPGIPVQVVDTVGAGDAFTAALLTQTLDGKSLVEAARVANAYSAVVCTKPGGTPIVSREEVEPLL